MKRVLIAGASGFIGRGLIKNMIDLSDVQITALSRRDYSSKAGASKQVNWKQCDLFSLKQLETVFDPSIDTAVYLVHSMLPVARLVQASFSDMDALLADNFVRVANSVGIKRIIYLSGIIPEGRLSKHLQSRLEVEKILQQFNGELIVLRSGLIIGETGSSFQMMNRLVRRLPMLICPSWAYTRGQPIYETDVIQVLTRITAMEDFEPPSSLNPKIIDLAGPEVLSYVEMMKRLSKILGKNKLFINIPWVPTQLSKLWVSVITGTSYRLVSPLVDSLHHDMLPTNGQTLLNELLPTRTSFQQSVINATSIKQEEPIPNTHLSEVKSIEPQKIGAKNDLVCSIARLPLGKNAELRFNALDLAHDYAHWLVKFFWPIIKVDFNENGLLDFYIPRAFVFGLQLSLLKLQLSVERSSESRALFYITGGLLLAKDAPKNGRLEFRLLKHNPIALASIFDFKPALPWYVYRNTQALVHAWVMRQFARHLKKRPLTPRSI